VTATGDYLAAFTAVTNGTGKRSIWICSISDSAFRAENGEIHLNRAGASNPADVNQFDADITTCSWNWTRFTSAERSDHRQTPSSTTTSGGHGLHRANSPSVEIRFQWFSQLTTGCKPIPVTSTLDWQRPLDTTNWRNLSERPSTDLPGASQSDDSAEQSQLLCYVLRRETLVFKSDVGATEPCSR